LIFLLEKKYLIYYKKILTSHNLMFFKSIIK
jgi:hypothetical protein